MATLTAPDVSAGVQPKGLRVGLVAVASTFSNSACLSTGDVIQMVKVPANATVVDLKISTSITAGSVTIGDGVDTDRYHQGYAMSLSGGLAQMTAVLTPYTYSTDDTIDVVVSASATMSAAGAINLIVVYSMDP